MLQSTCRPERRTLALLGGAGSGGGILAALGARFGRRSSGPERRREAAPPPTKARRVSEPVSANERVGETIPDVDATTVDNEGGPSDAEHQLAQGEVLEQGDIDVQSEGAAERAMAELQHGVVDHAAADDSGAAELPFGRLFPAQTAILREALEWVVANATDDRGAELYVELKRWDEGVGGGSLASRDARLKLFRSWQIALREPR